MRIIRNTVLLVIIMVVLLGLIVYVKNGESDDQAGNQFTIEQTSSLLIISLVTDPDNLWSEDKGIYILGNNASSKYPYKGANYWQDWTVPVTVEVIETGQSVYKSKAGLKIFGGETRTLPQKSLALYAKKKYGNKMFIYSFFDNIPLNQYKTLVLRNGGQDFSKTHVLDGLVSSLVEETNIDYQAYRPVIVYLNGVYWGIHDLREKIDVDFLIAHHGVSIEGFDLLEANAKVKEGDNRDYLQLIDFITQHDLSDEGHYYHVLEQIDMDNFMDYVIAELYIANTDWPSHNIRFWKERNSTGKWRWILYDSDLSFINYEEDTVAGLQGYKGKGEDALYISFLFREFMKNDQFRTGFYDRTMYHMANTFQSEHVIDEINMLMEQIQPEMAQHLDKWGGSMVQWESNIEQLREFANKRPEYLMDHLQALYESYD